MEGNREENKNWRVDDVCRMNEKKEKEKTRNNYLFFDIQENSSNYLFAQLTVLC